MRSTGVVQKNLPIWRQPSFWAVCNIWIRDFCRMSVNQTWDPYVRVGMIMATKILRHCIYEIPRMELPITFRAWMVLRALLASVVTWVVHWSVGVKNTPRYRSCVAICRVIEGREGG